MATEIKVTLPLGVTQVLGGPSWKGGKLVQLDSTITKATAEDIILNHCWIKPFILQFQDRVPSSFYLTDVFLYLDRLFERNLLIPLEEGESKQSLAAEEAKRVKNLIGALRGLWRSSISAII